MSEFERERERERRFLPTVVMRSQLSLEKPLANSLVVNAESARGDIKETREANSAKNFSCKSIQL